ncbi:MAG: hypothetical protein RIE22_03000 [Alphaproteobacteria bacterium]
MNLTLQDCIEFCELNEEVIDAIAEHEGIPEMAAAELGNYLIQDENGAPKIRAMIIDDIRRARDHGNSHHEMVLLGVLARFVEAYGAQDPATRKTARSTGSG